MDKQHSEIAKLTERISKDPRSKLFVPLAEEYKKAGDIEMAIHVLSEGLKSNAGYVTARSILGKLLFEQGELLGSQKEFEEVVKAIPDNLMAQRKLGDICVLQNRPDEAIKHYNVVLSLNPRDVELASLVSDIEAGLDVRPRLLQQKPQLFAEKAGGKQEPAASAVSQIKPQSPAKPVSAPAEAKATAPVVPVLVTGESAVKEVKAPETVTVFTPRAKEPEPDPELPVQTAPSPAVEAMEEEPEEILFVEPLEVVGPEVLALESSASDLEFLPGKENEHETIAGLAGEEHPETILTEKEHETTTSPIEEGPVETFLPVSDKLDWEPTVIEPFSAKVETVDEKKIEITPEIVPEIPFEADIIEAEIVEETPETIIAEAPKEVPSGYPEAVTVEAPEDTSLGYPETIAAEVTEEVSPGYSEAVVAEAVEEVSPRYPEAVVAEVVEEVSPRYPEPVAAEATEEVSPRCPEPVAAEAPEDASQKYPDAVSAKAPEEVAEQSDDFTTDTLAELYIAQGFYEKAIDIYERMLADKPDSRGLQDKLRRVRAMAEQATSDRTVPDEEIKEEKKIIENIFAEPGEYRTIAEVEEQPSKREPEFDVFASPPAHEYAREKPLYTDFEPREYVPPKAQPGPQASELEKVISVTNPSGANKKETIDRLEAWLRNIKKEK